VKCHESRLLQRNRELARKLMVEKLDKALNGEHCVDAQRNSILEKKSRERDRRRNKLEELKRIWKEREGV